MAIALNRITRMYRETVTRFLCQSCNVRPLIGLLVALNLPLKIFLDVCAVVSTAVIAEFVFYFSEYKLDLSRNM